MKHRTILLFAVFFVGLMTAMLPRACAETTVETAAEYINEAHKHDNMYTLGPEADQQKALSLYKSALAAEPDKKQRLHILYRMAQLYGSAYQLEKGEKPDFHKAISLYKVIVESYPPEEPLVYKSMSSLCGHYTTLREFETALTWSKKVVGYDTSKMQQQLKAIEAKKRTFKPVLGELGPDGRFTEDQRHENTENTKKIDSLKKALKKIKRYQLVAVDQVAYSANLIDPLRAHGELRAIIQKYSGTFIAERAHERLVENMVKMPNLWAPQNDEPFSPSGSTLQATGATLAAHSETQKNIQIQSNVTPEATEEYRSVEPNTASIPQKDKDVVAEPRAPPLSYLSKFSIIAAGLVVLALAVIKIRKK